MLLSIVVLTAAVVWIARGLALRLVGIFLMLCGLITPIDFSGLARLICFAFGLVLWLAGQWL